MLFKLEEFQKENALRNFPTFLFIFTLNYSQFCVCFEGFVEHYYYFCYTIFVVFIANKSKNKIFLKFLPEHENRTNFLMILYKIVFITSFFHRIFYFHLTFKIDLISYNVFDLLSFQIIISLLLLSYLNFKIFISSSRLN